MNKYAWNNKEIFLQDWEKNKNICSFLKSKGLTATSGNYQTFKKWFDIHNEKDLNFETNKVDIFTENSNVLRRTINKKIRELNLIPYRCACCGNSALWNGKKLTLQLEHKNGINNDNRIENLEYLCPNCHSQTGSFTGSNVHNKVFPKRLEDILDLRSAELNFYSAKILAIKWGIGLAASLSWLKKYKNKLQENDIYFCNNLHFPKPEDRKKDYLEYENDKDCVEKLIKIWKIKEASVKVLIKKYQSEMTIYNATTDKEVNDLNKKLKDNFNTNPLPKYREVLPELKGDIVRRKEDISLITTKKEIPLLAKKWNISISGAKKWIRNNMPDKFAEIYDDKHLEKNKSKVIKDEKINYIRSLMLNFNEEEALSTLNVNKLGLSALIKQYNPSLFEQIRSKHPCPKCNSNSRVNGKYQRCISCNHNFRPS